MNNIRLKHRHDSFTYHNHKVDSFSYLVVKDDAAGKKERYTVMILNAQDPLIIGRELDLKTIRELIKRFEIVWYAFGSPWDGDREVLLSFIEENKSILFNLKIKIQSYNDLLFHFKLIQ